MKNLHFLFIVAVFLFSCVLEDDSFDTSPEMYESFNVSENQLLKTKIPTVKIETENHERVYTGGGIGKPSDFCSTKRRLVTFGNSNQNKGSRKLYLEHLSQKIIFRYFFSKNVAFWNTGRKTLCSSGKLHGQFVFEK